MRYRSGDIRTSDVVILVVIVVALLAAVGGWQYAKASARASSLNKLLNRSDVTWWDAMWMPPVVLPGGG